jgi:hypothetical protein
MSNQADRVARILTRLQAAARRPPSGDRTIRSGRVPDDIATEHCKWLYLEPDEDEVYQEARDGVLGDPRFEYLEPSEAEEALWRFVCQCHVDRTRSHVAAFVARHARDILEVTCYLTVEHLEVKAEAGIAGLRLLPTTSDEIPQQGRRFVLDPPIRCVAAVPVSGTSYKKMADRGRAVAEHGLRLLRIALRESHSIHDDQLRFRLGEAYSFGDHLHGWDRHPGSPYPLALRDSDVEMVRSQPVAGLPLVPSNKLERQAHLTVRWIERASLATDPLVRLLYLFFALESLLGDTGEGQKAGLIALRRAMLSAARGQGFTHPSRTYWLYDQVRSAAVHGGEPPEVSDPDVRLFGADVREALDDYLTYGREHRFTRQSQLVQALDHHPDRPRLIEWIRENGGDMWDKYLDKIDPTQPTPAA